MEAPSECFQLAARYERLAAEATDEVRRKELLDAAAQWRTLGNDLQSEETTRPPPSRA
jgi:hypothetical protein